MFFSNMHSLCVASRNKYQISRWFHAFFHLLKFSSSCFCVYCLSSATQINISYTLPNAVNVLMPILDERERQALLVNKERQALPTKERIALPKKERIALPKKERIALPNKERRHLLINQGQKPLPVEQGTKNSPHNQQESTIISVNTQPPCLSTPTSTPAATSTATKAENALASTTK